jgi:hypothetical protein
VTSRWRDGDGSGRRRDDAGDGSGVVVDDVAGSVTLPDPDGNPVLIERFS